MPDFKGLENLHLILLFVVPGIVALSVRSKFITGRIPSLKEDVLAFVVVSLIYYSATVPFIDPSWLVKEPGGLNLWSWIALVLIGPGIFGLILGIGSQMEWAGWIADKFGFSIVHVIPTAWDWRFSKMPRNGLFVMVTLTDGSTVAGHFGSSSFASSDTKERDLYLEEEYQISRAWRWEQRSEKVGILIPAREIRHIEFWH
ncbi:MAG: DUF6338 family protein [Terracidiphilus sp.]